MRSGFGVNESESDACARCACNVFVCSNNGLLYCTQNAPFEAYCGAYCVLNIGAENINLNTSDFCLLRLLLFPLAAARRDLQPKAKTKLVSRDLQPQARVVTFSHKLES